MKQPVAPLVVNGWTILAHPQILEQLEALVSKVEALKSKDPANYKQKKSATKRLAAISRLAFEIIPQDPERDEYRQGDTLGGALTCRTGFRGFPFRRLDLFLAGGGQPVRQSVDSMVWSLTGPLAKNIHIAGVDGVSRLFWRCCSLKPGSILS